MKTSAGQTKPEVFAERLAQLIRERGWGQGDLACASNVSDTTVSRWLSGSIPRQPTAAGLSILLNVSIDWLFGHSDTRGRGEKFPVMQSAVPTDIHTSKRLTARYHALKAAQATAAKEGKP